MTFLTVFIFTSSLYFHPIYALKPKSTDEIMIEVTKSCKFEQKQSKFIW